MLTQIDSLADQNASLESQVEEQHVKIVELTGQRDQAEREASQAGDALTQTMNDLTETRRSIIALERDRDEVSGRLRRQNVMLESHLAKTDVEEDELGTAEMAELTRRDERRGLVYTSAPSQVDDLKKISGVARVLEQRLNEFGIYTYKQIMEWDPVAVEEFSKLLAFRDRIDRDNWIGQAAALFQKKHGRAA
jgi:predicted flap endonuclease-1-like 5' DNA nuclease